VRTFRRWAGGEGDNRVPSLIVQGLFWEGDAVSIVRVGLAETRHFAEGYEAIFGKKKQEEGRKADAAAKAEKGQARKKAGKKKE
jgi:hypothetical protein